MMHVGAEFEIATRCEGGRLTDGDGTQPLYLDDLSVGQKFESKTHTLDAPQIKSFARQFDPQPFHLDEAAAEASFFNGLAASGWHTACLTMKLIVGSVPISGGLIGAGGEISWLKPTRPGDTIRVVSEVTEIAPSRSRPDRGTVTLKSETFNQDGELLQVMKANLVVPRRSSA